MGSDSLIMLAGLGIGLYIVWKSGILSNIGKSNSGGSTDTIPATPPDTSGGTTTTPPPATGGGTTPNPTPTPVPTPQPVPTPIPPTGSNTCHTLYNGSCNVECANGATAVCQSCLLACGQPSLPTTGSVGAPNPSLCHSQYNGSCHTECQSPNSSACRGCLAACGAGSAYAITKRGYAAAVRNMARRQVLDAYYSQMRYPSISIS